jgi:hypothetical protein
MSEGNSRVGQPRNPRGTKSSEKKSGNWKVQKCMERDVEKRRKTKRSGEKLRRREKCREEERKK